MNLLQAGALGCLQGLTEFLPISSSAHLRVVPALLGWDDPGAAFTAVTQLGTEAAVLLYFRHDLRRIAVAWTRSVFRPAERRHPDARLGWWIALGTVPIGLLGLTFEDAVTTSFRDLRLVAATLVVLGVALFIADRRGRHTRRIEALNARDAVLLGLAQALALVPGVSRSGATISAGLLLHYDRASAARYAFLLAVPAVVISGFFQLPTAFSTDGPGTWPTLFAATLAFASGYAAIGWLLKYVSTRSFTPFVVYRVVLGVSILALMHAGRLPS